MPAFKVVTAELRFPEGPIAMADGSVILVEIERGTLTRVKPSGAIEIIAETGGGPNGAAMGPDGKCYVCNNGGFEWFDGDLLRPTGQALDYTGGRIERVDVETGEVEVLYTHCDGHPLRGPNDIVFDDQGGFYFSDLGKARPREMDRGGLYYAKADGSAISEVAYPVMTPNGVGLSPDGKMLYAAETETSRLWRWPIEAPGKLGQQPWPNVNGGEFVAGFSAYQRFDSMALEAGGNICVATLINGGVSVISPQGALVDFVPTHDPYCTNICFGGPDLKTAYLTLSGTGQLVALPWPRPGLPLHHLND